MAGYTVGTWSKKIRRSYVAKHGTQSDIAQLAPSTSRNRHPETTNRRVGPRRHINKVAPKKRAHTENFVHKISILSWNYRPLEIKLCSYHFTETYIIHVNAF